MSENYKISDKDRAYFLTITTVGWIGNKNYKVWQDGNQPKEIFSNNFFHEKLNYIHQNPVKDLIVEHAEEYLFSSARNYADLDAYLDIAIESNR